MILIDKTQATQQFAVTLWEHRTDYTGADNYTLTLINDSTKTETEFTLEDQSAYPARYNLFELTLEDMEDLSIGWHSYSISDEDGVLETGRCYIKGEPLDFTISDVYK